MYPHPLARMEKIVPYDKDNCILYFAGTFAGFSKCVLATDKSGAQNGKLQY